MEWEFLKYGIKITDLQDADDGFWVRKATLSFEARHRDGFWFRVKMGTAQKLPDKLNNMADRKLLSVLQEEMEEGVAGVAKATSCSEPGWVVSQEDADVHNEAMRKLSVRETETMFYYPIVEVK